jgi:hypothetical protein
VYLTKDTLKQRLQDGINQKLPQIAASQEGQLGGILGILQLNPTATVTTITDSKKGITIGLDIVLYPGAQTIHTSLYTTFKILNASTIQVNGVIPPGSSIAYNGPLTTITVPSGKVTSVQTISNCGSFMLAIALQFPIKQQASTRYTPSADVAEPLTRTTSAGPAVLLNFTHTQATPNASTIYAEVPAASLVALVSNIGTLSLGNGLEATNIKLSIQHKRLIVTTDIYSTTIPGRFIKVGTAYVTIVPTTTKGHLQMQVRSIDLQALVFTLSVNNYNQQIEQAVNNNLNSLISSDFTISAASIGPDPKARLTCVAASSLFLTGSANLA